MSPVLTLMLILFVASVIGGGMPLLAQSSERALHRLLSLAAGFFLGLVFLDLLPHLDFAGPEGASLWAWVLAGLLGILILDLGIFGKQSHAAVGWATLLGLTVHAFSMGLGLGMLAAPPIALAWGLAAHKFGESFSLASALRFTVKDRPTVLVLVIAFSLVTPIGLFAGDALREAAGHRVATIFAAIAAGSFLYVAVGDLLPEVFHDPEDRLAKLGMLIGGVAFAAVASAEGHVHGDHAHVHPGLLSEALTAFWVFFARAAPFLLLGFFAAALVHAWLPRRWLKRAMGGSDFRSVAAASAVGAPLPLCSCSVLPTAIGLHKSGASKPATVAFLVATPETGPDSIAVTWALIDPVMTVVRPIGAITSAMVAGFGTILFDKADDNDEAPAAAPHCSKRSATAEPKEPANIGFVESLRYSFVDVLDDIMPSLLLGTAVAALLTVLLPADLLPSIAIGPLGLFVAALLGAPIYVCAAASTPIAAALMLKGLSAGAALVFLLVGPATNLGSLLVLRKQLGKRVVTIYLTSVIATAIVLGALVDLIFPAGSIVPRIGSGADHLHETVGPISVAAAITLGVLCFASLRRRMSLEQGRRAAA